MNGGDRKQPVETEDEGNDPKGKRKLKITALCKSGLGERKAKGPRELTEHTLEQATGFGGQEAQVTLNKVAIIER